MGSSPLHENKFKAGFVFTWLLMFVDQSVVLHWYGLPWRQALMDSGISNATLLLASLLVITILRYYLPKYEQHVNIFAVCLLLTILWCIALRWGLLVINDGYDVYVEILKKSMPIRFSLGFLLLGCITLLSIAWFNNKEQKETEARKETAEKMTKEAELFKLRQQLQPHFLFNSLNSINALIGSRPEEARKMVQQLSDFLRGTIKKEETQWVSLQEELQYLQLYLDIEKVRFGNRLATETNVADEVKNMKLPVLLLQPIVENAIKFGLYDTTGETVISISAYEKEGNLLISVSNPFDPETSSPHKGTGFGLKSVQRRLYLLFARNDLLRTGTKTATTIGEENIFTTVVIIPQQKEI
jgi:two-component system, LytTR family, sensor kinase